LLNVNLDKVGEIVLVEVQHQVVDHVETITNDDKGKLI